MIAPMADELVESLKRVPIFAGVRDKELGRLVKAMRDSRFNEGEVITTEGRSGDGFFLIEDGNATVSLRGEIVRTLGPGDHFGEIALIDEGPRSATVTASTDLRCRGLAAWEFKSFVQEHPEVAWPLLETLASRLRDAEERSICAAATSSPQRRCW
jgi:CRP/FNR family transcriptional regulator